MATRQQFKMSTSARRRRRFSEDFKKKKVEEIEQGILTMAEVSREYDVRQNNVLKWVHKYGKTSSKGVRMIVELESDTFKLITQQKRIAELERLVGQKQVKIEFLEKMLELTEKEYKIDIKKKFESKP
jgi:transposase-like protein